MTAALKTGPHSGCLKELCVISSTKLWMDGLGTADTETAEEPETSPVCWPGKWQVLLARGVSCSVELLEGELSAASSS